MSYVSFAKEPYKRDYILQKSPVQSTATGSISSHPVELKVRFKTRTFVSEIHHMRCRTSVREKPLLALDRLVAMGTSVSGIHLLQTQFIHFLQFFKHTYAQYIDILHKVRRCVQRKSKKKNEHTYARCVEFHTCTHADCTHVRIYMWNCVNIEQRHVRAYVRVCKCVIVCVDLCIFEIPHRNIMCVRMCACVCVSEWVGMSVKLCIPEFHRATSHACVCVSVW